MGSSPGNNLLFKKQDKATYNTSNCGTLSCYTQPISIFSTRKIMYTISNTHLLNETYVGLNILSKIYFRSTSLMSFIQ